MVANSKLPLFFSIERTSIFSVCACIEVVVYQLYLQYSVGPNHSATFWENFKRWCDININSYKLTTTYKGQSWMSTFPPSHNQAQLLVQGIPVWTKISTLKQNACILEALLLFRSFERRFTFAQLLGPLISPE